MKFLCCCLVLITTSLTSQTVMIDPWYHQPFPVKDGYKLLFHDEFNDFDQTTWNVTNPGNDAPPYNDPDFKSKTYNSPQNPSNIIGPENGTLKIRVHATEEQNKADYSCGEIKTFDNNNWTHPENKYRSWTVRPGTYLEARVKIPQCTGINAAFWLYGIIGGADDPDRRFFEVDMFESFSNIPNAFSSNLHYGKEYGHKTHKNKPRRTYLKDFIKQPVILEENWLTFGVEWENDRIIMYVNGIPYNSYKLNPISNKSKFKYKKSLPAFIRIGTGKSSIESGTPANCLDLPQYYLIDYVRLYTKVQNTAIQYLDNYEGLTLKKKKGESDSGANIRVNYIPGVKYTWLHTDGLEIEKNQNLLNTCYCEQWWVSIAPNAVTGFKKAILLSEFPDGNKEFLELSIKIIP